MGLGTITTFYSYKGGVGRSMALANIACLLARWGHRVLCVDGDLEAPGLHYYLDVGQSNNFGFLDLLLSYGETTPLAWSKAINNCVHPSEKKIVIDLITSGAQNKQYDQRLQKLDWKELYTKYGLALKLEQLCNEWRENYDHILIDSRTGVTDIGGVLTIQVPDHLLIFCTANRQGLDGLSRIARQVKNERTELPLDKTQLPILPVITSFAGRFEKKLGETWLNRFISELGFLFEDWLHRDVTVKRFLNRIRIPYVPRWSFGEELPVATEDGDNPDDISYSLINLAALLAHNLANSHQLVEDREHYIEESLGEQARIKLRAVDSQAAEKLAQAETLHNLGREAQERRQWEVAEGRYKEALQIYIDLKDRHKQAGTLQQLEMVAQERQQRKELISKVAVNTITEVFKAYLAGFKKADSWFKDKNEKYDFFGAAARRYAEQMEIRYNAMRIFGMTKPVPLRSIYTRVNILEKITSRQRMSAEELEKLFDRDRRAFGTKIESKPGIAVVNNEQRMVVLGKPGAGKTTFLKYIVLQALDGKLREQRIPIFITLKDFADSPNPLMDFIVEQFDIGQFPEAVSFIERVLNKGKCLLLLDGLDEVSQKHQDGVIKQVRGFSDKYPDNQFIISCRIAAYSYWFEKFTDMEIADFDDQQIEIFVNNWFGKDTKKARLCWQQLNTNQPIKELAAIPLLLTLLCLAFDETMDFPRNRAELYKEAVDVLLKKWDASRFIKRDEIYRHLSPRRKETMFSRIAAETFEANQYFLPQRTLEKHIANFIENLPEANEEALQQDSGAILRAIAAQHGIFVERAKAIYSFSHLTFQEYFTAKYIVDNVKAGTLMRLIKNHLTNYQWREVFLLIAGMLDKADDFFLLMKAEIDAMVKNKKVGKLLPAVQREIAQIDARYPQEASRALALSYILARAPNLDGAGASARDIGYDIASALAGGALDIDRANRADTGAFEDALAVGALDIDRALFPDLNTYLKANQLLVDCLTTESYVSKATRQKILDELLTAP